MRHDFKKIEPKWQAKWEESKIFRAVDGSEKPKFYGLVEFPYPSGAGMHVGHIKAYSSIEVVSRKRRMQGYNVLFPIGFDAYGLPTENYAIKTKTHPRIITDKNIARFSEQLKRVGFSFDWDRVIDTTEEGFYKWTQWIFLKMFENGLVYRDKALVNYCPSCKVVLSNEDSQGGKCDICHSEVVQKSKVVWYLRITEYADKLLKGLDKVDYPDNIKQQQINWIGKSTGAFVDFAVDGIDEKLKIYTTRPDTLFGVTFMVIAPEHPFIDKYSDKIKNMDAVLNYRNECAKKSEFERTQLVKDKTGVKLEGFEAVNPITGKKIPVFIADYVMMGYGTGAIMAVPAHDQRDYDFAKKFGVDIIPVIEGGNIEEAAYTGEGRMINSDFLNGLSKKKECISKMIEKLEALGIGNHNLRIRTTLRTAVTVTATCIGHITVTFVNVYQRTHNVSFPFRVNQSYQRRRTAIRIPNGIKIIVIRFRITPQRILARTVYRHQHGVIQTGIEHAFLCKRSRRIDFYLLKQLLPLS